MLRPLLLLILLLAAALGRAGSYVRVYTGGRAFTNTGFPIAYKANASTDSYGSDGGTFASCGEEITATFTWSPSYTGEPAPPVVVDEWCVADYAWPDGSCSNAFGDPESNRRRGGTVGSPIHHYEVKQPDAGGKVVLKRTPSAVAGALSAYYYGACSVSYHASVSPVVLSLAGTRLDSGGNDECMIGKGITGSLSAGYPLDQHQWSIGGSTFKQYVASQSQGKVYYLTSTDLALEHPHWFWKEDACVIVSCTARVTLPDGTTKTVTGTRTVTIYSPYSAFAANLLSTLCYFDGSMMGTANPTEVVTWDPASGNDACIDFYGNAAAPSRFWEGGHGGVHCYVQLTHILDIVYSGGFPVATYSTGGRFDLDNDFPYPASMQGDFGPHMFWADSVENPGQPRQNRYVATDGPMLGRGLGTLFEMNDEYEMYQLYRPPGTDVSWVPLNVIKWSSSASGLYGFTGAPVLGSYVQIDSFGPTSAHPEWTNVFINH